MYFRTVKVNVKGYMKSVFLSNFYLIYFLLNQILVIKSLTKKKKKTFLEPYETSFIFFSYSVFHFYFSFQWFNKFIIIKKYDQSIEFIKLTIKYSIKKYNNRDHIIVTFVII